MYIVFIFLMKLVGYFGLLCQSSPCNSNPCLNNGVCSSLSSTQYTCTCPSNYSGLNCGTPVVSNPCASNPCGSFGYCSSNSAGGYSCTCFCNFLLCEIIYRYILTVNIILIYLLSWLYRIKLCYTNNNKCLYIESLF